MRRAATVFVLAAAAALVAAAGCFPNRPIVAPMPQVTYPAPPPERRTASRCLVVLLPGIRDVPSDFDRHGFPAIARDKGLACDLQAVDAHLGYFRQRQLVPRLREDVIAPARAAGYDEIWLAGISLGGLGSLLYAQARPEDVTGVLLFAPYLGKDDIVDEIADAGGLRSWSAGADPDASAFEAGSRDLWRWLKGYAAAGAPRPAAYIAYGEDDRFAESHELLGAVLPREHVFVGPGGHDWDTWRRLWARVLEARVLPSSP